MVKIEDKLLKGILSDQEKKKKKIGTRFANPELYVEITEGALSFKYDHEKDKNRLLKIFLTEKDKNTPDFRKKIMEKYQVSKSTLSRAIERGYFFKGHVQREAQQPDPEKHKHKEYDSIINGVKNIPEEEVKNKKRILVYLSEDDLTQDREKLRKTLKEKIKLSETTITRALRHGYFSLNHQERKVNIDENFAEKYIDIIDEKARIATYKLAKHYGINISRNYKLFQNDIIQETILNLLERSNELKELYTKNPKKFSLFVYIGARNYAKNAFHKYLWRKSDKHIPLEFDDGEEKPFAENHGELLSKSDKFYSKEYDYDFFKQGIENVPIKLKSIIKIFVEHGPELTAMQFNLELTPTIQKLLYQVAGRAGILNEKIFVNKVTNFIFQLFPEAKIRTANSGSLYIRIPAPEGSHAKEEYIGIVRISDHRKKQFTQQNILLDLDPNDTNWIEQIEMLYEKLNKVEIEEKVILPTQKEIIAESILSKRIELFKKYREFINSLNEKIEFLSMIAKSESEIIPNILKDKILKKEIIDSDDDMKTLSLLQELKNIQSILKNAVDNGEIEKIEKAKEKYFKRFVK